MTMRWMSPERRELAANTFVGAAAMTVAVAFVVWVLLSLIVGTVVLSKFVAGIG